ncbi:hypothetical protein V499_08995, partial [Pseudogymnoascus sp. VKM F-103]
MGRHRSGGGSSYRSDKRKTRDWDDPDGPGDAAERSPRVLYERFDPENISRLWRLYDTQWHHKPGERFLTRKEFTDLLEEMHTTKITEIHDEGMRRIKEARRRNEGRLASITNSPKASYVSTIPRTVSIASLTSEWSSRTPTPQPRARRGSTSSTVAHEQDQSLAAPSENRIMRARSNSLDAPKTPGETPPPPPPPPQQQRQQPYIPPTPAELDSATSVIRAACAAEEAQALARHSQQVKAAKALVWIDVIKLAGEIPCLAALVGGASGEDGEAAAATKGGPEGMTESALMSAFAGLMRWEEGAEKARECLVEAVGGLEGLG